MAGEDERTGRATVWGVVAGIFGAGAFTTWPVAVQPHSTFPVWPTYVFAAIAVLALYLCFATIWSWWPTRRPVEKSPSTLSKLSPPAEPAAVAYAQLPAQPIRTALTPQLGDAGALRALLPGPVVPGKGPGSPSKAELPPVMAEPELEPEETRAITDRWHETSDGGKVPSLMRLTHTSVFHPAYMRPSNEAPPFVKVGMLVGCLPLDPPVSGTEMRSKFLAFLGTPAICELVRSLTNVEPVASWKSMAGHGSRTLEAALTVSQDPLAETPIASALFLPPIADESLYGRDERTATLLLYIEPRTAGSEIPPPSELSAWMKRSRLALEVPGAFADFLSGELGATTSNDPPAQCGIWLQSNQPLTVMIDTGGLRVLPGSSPSNWFMGWAFAGPGGKPAAGTARDMIEHLCEYQLHLDGFE